MNLSSRFPSAFLYVFLASSALLLSACGGGGSGGSGAAAPSNSSSAPPASSGSGTGKITLIAGDDDISEWDQALFKISKIILLGGSDATTRKALEAKLGPPRRKAESTAGGGLLGKIW